jgi:deazaflavin-dependent oxidoreductase (nitroreductase family)
MLARVLQVVGWSAAVAAVLFVTFTISFRTKFGPVQDTIRRFNRAVANPWQLRKAGRPGAYASIVHHVGRISGTPYRTPVVAVEADDGFLFALPYGPGADWVRNILAVGSATVEHEGRSIRVDRPMLIPAGDANPQFEPRDQRMHRLYGVDDFLRVRAEG